MARLKPSAVREILKVAERPDILSFAGGLPAPELFPMEAIAQAHAEVLADEGRAALQYSTTEGYAPLREWIRGHMAQRGIRATSEQVLITNGSQQGIDLVAKAMLDPGDIVVVENPSYLAALQNFAGYEADIRVVGSDDEGMCVDELEELVTERRLKLIYLVPNFSNPKGTTLSVERRHALVRFAQTHGVLILEDNPYGELRFRGTHLPPLASLDEAGVVVHLGTFSKTLAPGLRIGWAVGPKELIRSLTIIKQAADLHTATLAQRATYRLLQRFDYEGHLSQLRLHYGARCQAMLNSLTAHMPKDMRWTHPDGGMFLWAELPRGLSGDELFPRALEQRVAFVPGTSFFAANPQPQFIRLNYSNRPPEIIDEGMRRLGAVLAAK
ncbi:PLP-dependent aminotransferase family protein [Hyalangium rubrum]|uniref:PLP-dependent aminotransferase family protein n=1 Tax=Hyalangium rubrum TaxID=3103134 RepID=A0ABU5HA55_9BACT|nr:PLP-dependent aminotransferase family protein [Hyalangium sp. s54d21]MDY7230372.1 PLP-dependent aminotransferase family protein [Hyalangium sp. s54d21]